MSNPTIRIHDIETDEIIDREMTDEEFVDYKKRQDLEIKRQAELQAKADAKQALLERLGITADEAKLLLG